MTKQKQNNPLSLKLRRANRAWIVSVDMGYGHQRAAYPLRGLDHQEVINANNYKGIPDKDRKIWKSSRKVYEAFSRFKNFPIIGQKVWDIFDSFQRIDPFYPRRNLTRPSMQLKQTYRMIKKKQWGKHLIEMLGKDPYPFITTFFIPAFMAEVWEYPGSIYCVVTDADISRAWAPMDTRGSRIHYLAPTQRVEERLRLYGVPKENITMTGFPLPNENIGEQEKILKQDLWRRIIVLDPTQVFHKNYGDTLEQFLGKKPKQIIEHEDSRVWVMFAIGGAGAQRKLAAQVLKSLSVHIKTGKIGMYLVAGIHNDVEKFFKDKIAKFRLNDFVGKGIRIISADEKQEYFHKFNLAIRETDVLWTKPSELSFYSALGLPIIIAPPIGSQEHFNKYWLEVIGAGIPQENPKYTHEWIMDYLKNGWLAECALQGYLEAPRDGVERIKEVVFK
ncbi:hypothetical protein KKF64_03290 [Patescibacteria group bacterium]|nr:hypothetical protein [Patescibacteria group bacterium]